MLADSLKKDIQAAYTRLLDSKGYRPRHCQKLMIAEVARVLGAIESEPVDEEATGEVSMDNATANADQDGSGGKSASAGATGIGKKAANGVETGAEDEAADADESGIKGKAAGAGDTTFDDAAASADESANESEADSTGAETSELPWQEPCNTCVVEAGTGTGKTVAYALAAIPVAQALDKKIVISTATVALQEQIVHRDLPDIRDHSKLDFDFILAKGRRRYLCLAKLDMAMQKSGAFNHLLAFEDSLVDEGETDASDEEVFKQLHSQYHARSWDGDRDSWPDVVADRTWQRISTDHAQCTGRRCSHYDNCCFYNAREDIHRVNCVVTNHDLVLADLMMGGGAILPAPEDSIYIFDEGHHLPDKAASHFSHTAQLYATRSWLQQLPTSLRQAASDLDIADPSARVEKQITDLLPMLDDAAQMLLPFQQQADHDDGNWRYTFPLGQVPDELRQACHNITQDTDKLNDEIEKFQSLVDKQIEDASGPSRDLTERWLAVVSTTAMRLQGFAALWHSFASVDEGAPKARWVNFQAGGGVEGVEMVLSSCPVSVADDLVDKLWERSFGVVITSATLSVGGDFSKFQQQTGLAPSNRFVTLPSPFDYAGRARLRVPAMRTMPSDRDDHTHEIAEMLPGLLASESGSLVLFTSWWQMRLVLEEIDEDFGDRVLAQGNFSKMEIINRHKEVIDDGGQSCIFGLASFAEGIDLPGHYCTHVVIAKIPFAVPDDPVAATLSAWIEERGGNSFLEVSVPDAAIRLVQMCGRLLRTETDEGQVTVLDRRLVTKKYGKRMLNALPPFARVFK